MDSIIAFIFARGGSKGVPGKNIRLLAGKPLIGWAIEQARSVDCIDEVIVSTDDPLIAEIARDFDAKVPALRPSELATDTSPEWLSWQQSLRLFNSMNGYFPERMLVLPTTSPLRKPIDIMRCLHHSLESDADLVLTTTPAARNPYYNMVERRRDGSVALLAGNGGFASRQTAPACYDLTTVAYVAKPSFVLNSSGIFAGKGRIEAVDIPQERALGIDTELDFRIAEALFSENFHDVQNT